MNAGISANEQAPTPTRRQFLHRSAGAAGSLLIWVEKLRAFELAAFDRSPYSPEDKQLGIVEFVGESSAPLDSIMGTGLDARMQTNL